MPVSATSGSSTARLIQARSFAE
ncbi:hypothetical protein RB2654_13970 [Rhodobacterales bacterium HTCC2654]|uniref:Uncharacterized protein n=1 Tax=Maritimibacter alkaliphilus HTCC2654 TaxID=314271 RepID=A3VGJ3_9RHOB|nr:hypothetical protein RB2654_13970 [Rhodobacterales bacterium HTCC2654] [Maritimibacter alkaliphilus HTCC2654]